MRSQARRLLLASTLALLGTTSIAIAQTSPEVAEKEFRDAIPMLERAETQFIYTAKLMDNCEYPDAENKGWFQSIIHNAGTSKMSWSDADGLMLYGGSIWYQYSLNGPQHFTPETMAAYREWRSVKLEFARLARKCTPPHTQTTTNLDDIIAKLRAENSALKAENAALKAQLRRSD